MAEWQPIETAPKNRKLLVAYPNVLGNWRIVTACYHTQLPWSEECDPPVDAGDYAPAGWYEESDSHETILPTTEKPTHWMPLPKAPEQSQ